MSDPTESEFHIDPDAVVRLEFQMNLGDIPDYTETLDLSVADSVSVAHHLVRNGIHTDGNPLRPLMITYLEFPEITRTNAEAP